MLLSLCSVHIQTVLMGPHPSHLLESAVLCVHLVTPLCHVTLSLGVYIPLVVCSASIYPESYIPVCLVVARRWTFATDRSGCSEIRFSPCGQEEEGYNVFADQETCERTCGHLTIGYSEWTKRATP